MIFPPFLFELGFFLFFFSFSFRQPCCIFLFFSGLVWELLHKVIEACSGQWLITRDFLQNRRKLEWNFLGKLLHMCCDAWTISLLLSLNGSISHCAPDKFLDCFIVGRAQKLETIDHHGRRDLYRGFCGQSYLTSYDIFLLQNEFLIWIGSHLISPAYCDRAMLYKSSQPPKRRLRPPKCTHFSQNSVISKVSLFGRPLC